MRHTIWILLSLIFLMGASSAQAADPKELFGAILGQIEGHIQRKQQRNFRKRIKPYWQACARGDVDACDRAETFPLSPQSRAQLERMRELAIGRPEYERNWYACQKMDIAACSAALRFPGAAANDRRSLHGWLRRASEQQRREQASQHEQQKLRSQCLVYRVMSACSELLASSSLSQVDRSRVYQLREQLLAKQRRERAAEASRVAFQALARKCFDGQLHACQDAISHPGAIHTDKLRLIAKRDQVRAENDARERRLADQREFSRLKTDCFSSNLKNACVAAAEHRLASQMERRRFERKQYELSSLPEQLMSLFAKATSGAGWTLEDNLVPILIIVLCILGAAVMVGYAIRVLRRRRSNPPPSPPKVPVPEPVLAAPFTTTFPLTGHLPTDVRQVLHGS
jgi:hypothetical protein